MYTDIYNTKSNWKWYLAIAGLIIVMITMFYTHYLAKQLIKEEDNKAYQFGEALKSISSMPDDTLYNYCDLTLHTAIIRDNNTIPIVLLDESNKIESYRNIAGGNEEEEMDTAVVRTILNKMIASGANTIVVENAYFKKYLVYTHSSTLHLLQLYPFLQLFLVAGFIGFGYMAFSSARRSEQNQVWVGMAKETAHQLGTPISAIIGWIENLKLMNEDNEDNLEMLNELRNDVTRLELVADRFSKIGAVPELDAQNIYEQLDISRQYMERRSPKRIKYEFPDPNLQAPLFVKINPHLLDWVLENLLRNAIDAMETGEGTIYGAIVKEDKYARIEISDTGKGIPHSKFKSIFKPGYSTKKRGWGLGLSLSKRIVEEYHSGKIFVSESEADVRTTFVILLPL